MHDNDTCPFLILDQGLKLYRAETRKKLLERFANELNFTMVAELGTANLSF